MSFSIETSSRCSKIGRENSWIHVLQYIGHKKTGDEELSLA